MIEDYEILIDPPAGDEEYTEVTDPGELWEQPLECEKPGDPVLSEALTTARDVGIANWLIANEIPLPTDYAGWAKARANFYALPYEERSKWHVRPTARMVEAARLTVSAESTEILTTYHSDADAYKAMNALGHDMKRNDVEVDRSRDSRGTRELLESELRTSIPPLGVDAVDGVEADVRPAPLEWADGLARDTGKYDAVGWTEPAGDPARDVEHSNFTHALRVAGYRLTDRERQAVHCVFYDGLTQNEAAERIGVSQPRVAQLLQSAATRLRNTV